MRTGRGRTILLTPPLTRPPLTRQDFRSPCDVELAGEDCTTTVCNMQFTKQHKELQEN